MGRLCTYHVHHYVIPPTYPPVNDLLKLKFRGATVEPLSNYIPQQKLDELAAALDNPDLSHAQKKFAKRKISGMCSMCDNVPTKMLKYKRSGMIIVERYCDDCLGTIRLPNGIN